MASEQNHEKIIEDVKRLEEAFNAEISSRKRATRAMQVISASLCCTILFFVLFNVFHLRSQWTEDDLKRNLEEQMQELSPVAMHEFSTLGQALLPVYAAESRVQIERLLPEISDAVQNEVDQLCSSILTTTSQRIEECQNRVLAATEKELFAAYPDLKDPVKREELSQRFRATAEEAALASLAEFNDLFTRDADEIKELILKFEVHDTGESQTDLQKRFLRLWLKLLDQEIAEL